MAVGARPVIPPTKRVALVDTTTWLFSTKTMDALRRVLAQDSIDKEVLFDLVAEALADQSIEMRTTDTQVQYRSSENDSWHTLLLVEDLKDHETAQALVNHINSLTPHSAYDDMPDLTLLFNNGLV
jgi:hypothetical protein